MSNQSLIPQYTYSKSSYQYIHNNVTANCYLKINGRIIVHILGAHIDEYGRILYTIQKEDNVPIVISQYNMMKILNNSNYKIKN